MDGESGEFMEEAELVSVGRSESKMERPARGCRREAVKVIISPARTDNSCYYQSELGLITIIISSPGRTDISAGMSQRDRGVGSGEGACPLPRLSL